MASSKWKTFEELGKVTSTRPFIFWGASNWIERTLEELNETPEYIVDKSELNQGIQFNNLDVKAPSEIDLQEKPFVIISTVNYSSVIDALEELGYVMGEDYCCTPLLNERKAKDDLLNCQQTVLVSSSQHYADESTGGGIYKIKLNTCNVEKVYIGKCRGITYSGGFYYLIDMLRGVVVLDNEFNEVKLIELQKNCEPHGLWVDAKRNALFVGQPGRDSVAVYNLATDKMVSEFFVSDKWSRNKKDNHHVNDPFVHGDSLFISMFSFSGNWLNEMYDGGILEFDLETGEKIGPVISGMWMPHSVIRVHGKLTFLNSMVGELWHGSYGMLGKFSGFTRGLDFDGKYYYIATTQHRYPEKLIGISSNVSMDTGFFVFDPETKMSKFYSMDYTESIHSLILLGS